MNVTPLTRDEIKGRVSITVNGRPVQEYIGEEEGKEIRNFYYSELRGLRRGTKHHIISAHSGRNTSKVTQVGNGSIRVQ